MSGKTSAIVWHDPRKRKHSLIFSVIFVLDKTFNHEKVNNHLSYLSPNLSISVPYLFIN